MPRTHTVVSECDACALGVGLVDDTDKLEEEDKDTGLPENWAELTLRVKVKNPEWTQTEANIKTAIARAWTAATRQAATEKGSALTSEEVEALRDVLERQARAQTDDVAELVIVEYDVVLCHEHVELLGQLGVNMLELFEGFDHPSVRRAGPTTINVQAPTAASHPAPTLIRTPLSPPDAAPQGQQDDGSLAPSVA